MDRKFFVIFLSLFFGAFFSSILWAKDPTQPLLLTNTENPKKTSSTEPVEQPLTAIFIKNSKRFAMIEGKIYQAGEYYRDSRIVNIFQDKVLLRSSQGNFQLTLIPNIKK